MLPDIVRNGFHEESGAKRVRRLVMVAILLAGLGGSPPAFGQQTLYRNSLSAGQNTLGNTSGWSTSSTASGVTPTSVTALDTLTFSNWWTPGKLSTAVWLDAADASTITLTSGTVTQWQDKSGNARNATIPATYSGPAVATLSGMPSIQFTTDALGIPTAAAPGSNSALFGVFQSSSTGAPGTGLININSSPGDNPEIRIGMGAANGSYWNGGYVLQSSSAAYTTRAVQGQTFTTSSGTTTTALLTNGQSVATGSRATGSGFQNYNEFRLGHYSRVGYRNGDIQELLTIQSSISSGDRALIEGYLAWKWGLQSSLPADHPYKNAAPVSASETVYLGGNQSAAGLVFSGSGSTTTLLGGTSGGAAADTLSLGAGGITQAAGAGATTLGAASGGTVSLAVAADQTWANNSSSLLQAFNGISRTAVDTTSRTLTVAGSGNTRLDGAIADGGAAGTLGLLKSGAGTLTLFGTSSYTGATTVDAGSLLVNGQLGNTAVTVNSGGLLGGSGSILGSVSVLAGGTFSPGNSPELLSVGSLSLAGTTLMEIDGVLPRGAAGGYDATNVTGLLTYGGSLLIDFGADISSALPNNTTFDLFAFGSYTDGFSSITTAADGSFYGGLSFASTGGGDKWTATKGQQTLEFTHSTGNLVIVPEPGVLTLALAGIGSAAAAYALRRRKARSCRTPPAAAA